MRIGFECSHLDPTHTGLYTYCSQLLWHLARADDRPDIVLLDVLRHVSRQDVLKVSENLPPTARYVPVRPLPFVRALPGPWHKRYIGRVARLTDDYLLASVWDYLEHARATGEGLARWRLPRRLAGDLDVCHWPFEDAAIFRIPGAAHVVTIHDVLVLRFPDVLNPGYVTARTRRLQAIARHATRIIADSDNTRRDAINLLGIAAERIDVIPLAADPALRPPEDRAVQENTLGRYGLRDQDYILYVGKIEPRKNVVRLATAFKAVIAQAPDLTTRLVLAGSSRGLPDPTYRALQELGLGGRLLMPGRVPSEDLPALLHGARAVAYVSLYEGFGLPPLEAMACGTPVVASNTSSIPEVVGNAGLLVDPYDVAAIAAALHRVLTDDALRTDLAARSLRRATHFSWAKTAELTLESYRAALAHRRRADHSIQRAGRPAPCA